MGVGKEKGKDGVHRLREAYISKTNDFLEKFGRKFRAKRFKFAFFLVNIDRFA